MPRRLVENGVSGFVVPVDRPQGAAEAIARLATDRGLLQRCSEAARINARRWQERALMPKAAAPFPDHPNAYATTYSDDDNEDAGIAARPTP